MHGRGCIFLKSDSGGLACDYFGPVSRSQYEESRTGSFPEWNPLEMAGKKEAESGLETNRQ